MVKEITAKNSFMGFRKGNVFEKLHNALWKSITFGCDALDSITDGGIPCNGITELFGESSAGKTQICYQLALTVQLPPKFGGLNKGVFELFKRELFFTSNKYVFNYRCCIDMHRK